MKPNFILIHSTGGGPEETFYPCLRKAIEKKGFNVISPFMTTPEEQTLENWFLAFEPYEKYVNENTIFMGRSIGPAFILRYLEKNNKKIKAAFLVAGFCSDIGMPQFRKVTESFISKPFDWEKIRKNCRHFFVYNSDNDPYVPLEKGEELAKNLKTQLRLIKGAEHFWFSGEEEKFVRILMRDIAKII